MKNIKECIDIAEKIAKNNPTVDIEAKEITEIIKSHEEDVSSLVADSYLLGLYKGITAGQTEDGEMLYSDIPMRINEIMIQYYDDEKYHKLSVVDKAKYNILVNVMGVNNAGLLVSILTFVSALKKGVRQRR